jgi:hypothetical protein
LSGLCQPQTHLSQKIKNREGKRSTDIVRTVVWKNKSKPRKTKGDENTNVEISISIQL